MQIFFAVSIPVDVPDRSISASFYFEANYGMPTINTTIADDPVNQTRARRSVDRQLVYEVIESKFER